MSENMEFVNKKDIESRESGKEAPLSVRVDGYYKDLFLELSDRPGFSRKRLLETMISSYIRKEKDESRQNNLNLEHEISLISGSLEDILKVFKTISIKAQDTIGSTRGFYEQQIEGSRKISETLELKIKSIEEERKEVVIQNKNMELKMKEVLDVEKELRNKIVNLEDDLTRIKEAYSTALAEVYNLRKIEGENLKLISENKELVRECENNKININRKDKELEKFVYDYEVLEHKKDKEIEILKRELILLKEEIKEIRSNKELEVKELENIIRRELEIKKEMEILTLRQEYNKLQIQYIRDIEGLNSNK